MDKINRVAAEHGVVIFSKSSCCLGYTINFLFQELRVNPLVYEMDHDPEGRNMEMALMNYTGWSSPAPAVFIGGKFMGSTNEIMSLHLSGKLVPLIKHYEQQGSNALQG